MRETRIEVWLPPDELERVRAYARLRGLKRKVPGREEFRGNVSLLVRQLIKELAGPEGGTLLDTLKRSGWTAASLLDVPERPVRVPVRCSVEEREKMKALAASVGMLRGGQGDVSAFLRALLRLRCGL